MVSAVFVSARLSLLMALSLTMLPLSTIAGTSDELLRAADAGECIENAAFRMIKERGPEQAESIVRAALAALAQRVSQQRALGCGGDIAAQAIAAGADPEKVLAATAAGL